jgi:S-ribosylhomocysteine lyase LuxS involved in autoinducer biosynthesis
MASMGSMLDALHAGYMPETIQTTTPMSMATGTYMILAGSKKYAVVPIIASTTV